jgi:hypothetical protein
MSETYDKIQAEIKSAMKEGNALVRDTLRMVVADIKNKTVNEGKEITEEIVVSCLKKFAKQEEDSIASAKAANRNDLVEKATQELSVVSQFLPKMMTERQMEDMCQDFYANFPDKKFGELMKMLPPNCDKKICAKFLQGLLKG